MIYTSVEMGLVIALSLCFTAIFYVIASEYKEFL